MLLRKIIQKKYKETSEREDINQENEYNQFKVRSTAMNLNLDSKRNKLKRNQKTINLGETPQEMEYNMKSINRPKKALKENLK